MNSQKFFDYIILFFLFASIGCLSAIQIRKTKKHGAFKAVAKELDSFDKKMIKISFGFLVAFFLLLYFRLS